MINFYLLISEIYCKQNSYKAQAFGSFTIDPCETPTRAATVCYRPCETRWGDRLRLLPPLRLRRITPWFFGHPFLAGLSYRPEFPPPFWASLVVSYCSEALGFVVRASGILPLTGAFGSEPVPTLTHGSCSALFPVGKDRIAYSLSHVKKKLAFFLKN